MSDSADDVEWGRQRAAELRAQGETRRADSLKAMADMADEIDKGTWVPESQR